MRTSVTGSRSWRSTPNRVAEQVATAQTRSSSGLLTSVADSHRSWRGIVEFEIVGDNAAGSLASAASPEDLDIELEFTHRVAPGWDVVR
jgi:hypothetical protein